MSDLIDAKLIIKKTKKGFATFIEIEGKELPFSRYKFSDDKLNGNPCQVNKQKTKIIVDGKTYPPEGQTVSTSNKQRHQSQSRSKSHKTHSQTDAKGEQEVPDSVDIQKTKLPKDTKDIGFKDIDNFALKLNKAVRVEYNDKKNKEEFKFFEADKGKVLYQIKPNFGDLKFEDFKTKMDSIKTALENQGYKIIDPISKKPDWRLVVGLGNESVYETSMTLHHVYGIPYIPGSAVKGITRHYVITQILGKEMTPYDWGNIEKILEYSSDDLKKLQKENDLKKKFTSTRKTKDTQETKEPSDQFLIKLKESKWLKRLDTARTIFGTQENAGKVVFFDAFPTTAPTIEPDIMNPHYGDYYSGKTDNSNNPIPPADYLSPNPIFFLTVKGATFDFYLGKKQKETAVDLDKAKKWLEDALQEQGIGAKSAVGYGYFS